MEKVSYINLSNYLDSLNMVLDKVSGKAAFVVARNHRLIEPEVKTYNDKVNEIIRKYGDEQDDGTIRIVDPEKIAKADEEYIGISNLEISLDILKINEHDIENSNMTAREILAIDWMVDHPEPEKAPAAKANEELPGDEDRFGI